MIGKVIAKLLVRGAVYLIEHPSEVASFIDEIKSKKDKKEETRKEAKNRKQMIAEVKEDEE
jgi:hypothetical protein